MTSRLKRKLNDLGVDTSSSKATENFCLIGTPLPPLEKSKDTGEFVPLWKQEVRDEKGRRRLHGAFTGGFSAGYFNSVGSKEGWTPSEFRSSRTDRAKKKESRPEDFMDEDDLAELREAQELVDTTEQMDLDFRGQIRSSGGREKDSIESALVAALLPAPNDSVGAQILKRMGWRIGHGIGPKVTYNQRKRQDALSHAPVGSDGALPKLEDHEEAKKHLYPRRDTKVPIVRRKDDKCGLGYEAGPGLAQLIEPEASTKDRSASTRDPRLSAGFGLGALNDADEDDLDVYDSGSIRTSRRLAYDADEDDERVVTGNRPKSMREASFSQGPGTPNKFASRISFSNGSPCLPSFGIAENLVTEENLFPPPNVPKDWMPDPRRVWEQDKENFKSGPGAQSVAERATLKERQSWRRSEMTAEQRGSLLGETALPTTPRSVFDYLTAKDRERLKNLAAGRAQLGAATVEDSRLEPRPTASEQAPTVPSLDPQVARMALQGFQPFTNDPVKQARYSAYLTAQASGEDSVPFSRMPGQAVDAFARELEDYARSARIFKPVSGTMAGRFTRAVVVDTGAKALEGLHRPAEEGSFFTTPGGEGKEKEPEKEESPKENAARLGMFGPLTREIKSWVPARLLCKRFGVKEPEVESPLEATATATPSGSGSRQKGEVLSITQSTEAGLTRSTQIGGSAGDSSSAKASSASKRDIANIGLGDEDETQGRDILTYERPGMDIFKAIFASDEEDVGEGEEEVGDEGVVDKHGATSQDDANVANGTGTTKSDAGPSAAEQAPPRSVAIDYNNMAGKFDISDFKPTFVSRSDRTKGKEKEKRNKGKEKDREKKKKRHKVALVSFEVDEGGRERERDRAHDVEKTSKKKRNEKRAGAAPPDDDHDMWVEKPPPDTVKNFIAPAALTTPDTTETPAAEEHLEAGPLRGRKRAIDFM